MTQLAERAMSEPPSASSMGEVPGSPPRMTLFVAAFFLLSPLLSLFPVAIGEQPIESLSGLRFEENASLVWSLQVAALLWWLVPVAGVAVLFSPTRRATRALRFVPLVALTGMVGEELFRNVFVFGNSVNVRDALAQGVLSLTATHLVAGVAAAILLYFAWSRPGSRATRILTSPPEAWRLAVGLMLAAEAPHLLSYLLGPRGENVNSGAQLGLAVWLLAMSAAGIILILGAGHAGSRRQAAASLAALGLVVAGPLLTRIAGVEYSAASTRIDAALFFATLWLVGIDWFRGSRSWVLRSVYGLFQSFVALPATVLRTYAAAIRDRFDAQAEGPPKSHDYAPALNYALALFRITVVLFVLASVCALLVGATLASDEIRGQLLLAVQRMLPSGSLFGVEVGLTLVLRHAILSLFVYFVLTVPLLVVTVAALELLLLVVRGLECIIAGASAVGGLSSTGAGPRAVSDDPGHQVNATAAASEAGKV